MGKVLSIPKDWQQKKWVQILAVILGVTASYLTPILVNLMNDDAGLNVRTALISLMVFGGIIILFVLVLLRFLCGERIRDLNLKGPGGRIS